MECQNFYRQIIINEEDKDIMGIIVLPVLGSGNIRLMWLGHPSEIREKIPNSKWKAISMRYLLEFESEHNDELQHLYNRLPHKTVEIMRGVVEDFIRDIVRSVKYNMKEET